MDWSVMLCRPWLLCGELACPGIAPVLTIYVRIMNMTLLRSLRSFCLSLMRLYHLNTSCLEKTPRGWLISKRSSRKWATTLLYVTNGSRRSQISKLNQLFLTSGLRMRAPYDWVQRSTRALTSIRQNSFWKNSRRF